MFDPVDYINVTNTNTFSMSNKCSMSVAMLINHGYWHTTPCNALFSSASETLLYLELFRSRPQVQHPPGKFSGDDGAEDPSCDH